MKHLILFLLALGSFCAPLRAAATDAIAAVQRADAARVKATIAGDAARLGELLTDDLVYGQNDGRIQTKAEFMHAVATNAMKYEAFDYEETKLVETAPHVVTMTGRARLKISRGKTSAEFGIRFLAVWREDNGKWRLHAYQSTQLPERSSGSLPKSP